MTKMAEQEDPELTSCPGHTKITTVQRASIYESDLERRRKELLQLKIERRNQSEIGGVKTEYSQDPAPPTPSQITHK